MSAKQFAISTVILIVSGFLVRVLGFVYRIFLSNAIGAEGMGLFQLVMPVYSLIVLTLTSGLSISCSRMIAARTELDKGYNPKKIVKTGLFIAGFSGALVAFVLYFFSEEIALHILGDERTLLAIKALVVCVPMVALGAAYRGYYYGVQRVSAVAGAQVMEQITRILLIALFAGAALDLGAQYLCALAVGAAALGEVVNFLVLFLLYPSYTRKQNKRVTERARSLLPVLVKESLPISVNRFIISIVSTIETVMIPQFLVFGGMTYKIALEEFGKMSGMASPLIYFPSLITGALSTSLVAELSKKMALGDLNGVNTRVSKSVTITVLMGTLFTCVFTGFSDEISELLYAGMDVGPILKMMGFSCVFIYVQMIMMGILNGLGKQVNVLVNTLLGNALRIALIIFVVPKLGLRGYAFGMIFTEGLVAILCINSVRRVTKLKIEIKNWIIKPVAIGIQVALIIPMLKRIIVSSLPTMGNMVSLVLEGGLLLVVFILCIFCYNYRAVLDFGLEKKYNYSENGRKNAEKYIK